MFFNYLFLLGAILSTAFGQVFYKKYTTSRNQIYLITTVSLFVLAPIFSYIALQNISIDVVYVFTALTVFIVMLLSKFFLKEVIKKKTFQGVFLVLLGIVLYVL